MAGYGFDPDSLWRSSVHTCNLGYSTGMLSFSKFQIDKHSENAISTLKIYLSLSTAWTNQFALFLYKKAVCLGLFKYPLLNLSLITMWLRKHIEISICK